MYPNTIEDKGEHELKLVAIADDGTKIEGFTTITVE